MPSCFPCDVSDTWCESCCVASQDVFERHARQLEVRSFSFDASKFVFRSVFSIYRDDMSTVCPNISAKPPSKYGKRPLPVDLHRSRPQKRLCLSSLLAKRWSTCPSWVTGDQQHENENCFLVLRKAKNHIQGETAQELAFGACYILESVKTNYSWKGGVMEEGPFAC